MVRTLITISLLIAMHVVAAGTTITLDQGANIALTAPAANDRMAFDFAGQIWLTGDTNQPASLLTTSGTLNQRPAFSRDGQLIAYESLQAGYRQIFVTHVASGVTRQVTFGPYDHLTPAWSPASSPRSRLVMASNRGGNFDIWEVDIDNLALHQLTFSTEHEHDPAWNDDGTRLAYVAKTVTGSALYILTPGNQPQSVVHERASMVAPAWRPGGGLLTYTRQKKISSQLRMLLLSTPPITKPITRQEQASPHPVHWLDRDHFLYAADGKIRHRELGLPVFNDVPFSVTLEINRSTRATRDTSLASNNRPVRGSDGQTERADGRLVIAMLSDLWEFQRENDGELTLIRQLMNDAYVDARPTFSPAGQHLAFISDRSGSRQIWTMAHDSLDMRRLTRAAPVSGAPAWSPDGKAVAYLVSDDNDGYRLRLVNVASRRWQTLAATSRQPGQPVFTDGVWSINPEPGTLQDVLTDQDQPAVPLSWRPTNSGNRYIIRAGRIFDGIGPGYTLRQELVIERNLIVAIRPWSDVDPDLPVIDASAHTVIPGLIDLTVRQEPYEAERNGRKWLAAGVTTIRMTPGRTVADFDRAIERFESWDSNRRIGPRLMLTVRPCYNESGLFDPVRFEQILTNAMALNIVALELCPDLARETLSNVISRAHEQGMSIIATTPVLAIMLAADELQPETGVPNKNSQPNPVVWQNFLLVGATIGTAISSRLVTTSQPGEPILNSLKSSWQSRRIFTAAERRRFNTSWQLNRVPYNIAPMADPNRIQGTGGGIILGSEAPSTPQGLGLHGEMRRLVANGLQPFQVLKMASLDAARRLGSGSSLGLIRVG
ncbi:MAG: hypothetical protein QGH93_13795, partial [Gammaproteobacteria bacterium]|nr:hypothetical protein [Gammaproteobacteria bacterium]